MGGHDLVVTGSVGISIYPRDGDAPGDLLKAADAPYEDEPFSYLVATRAEGPKPVDLRIIAERATISETRRTLAIAADMIPAGDDFRAHYALDESDERFASAKYAVVDHGRAIIPTPPPR